MHILHVTLISHLMYGFTVTKHKNEGTLTSQQLVISALLLVNITRG